MIPSCNLCQGTSFKTFKNRGKIECVKCGSIERTRLLKMYLDRFAGIRPGLRVLHFAPERPLFRYLAGTIGPSYEIKDLNVARYASFQHNGVSIAHFDLCKDCPSLPSDSFDLILHNHVLEHLPCNFTAVLWHLQRALKPDGLQMFSIPIFPGFYECRFGPLPASEREARFHHPQHFRTFGRDDLELTLGALFDIRKQMEISALELFGEDQLRRHNIPRSRWQTFTGANPFILRKNDFRLR